MNIEILESKPIQRIGSENIYPLNTPEVLFISIDPFGDIVYVIKKDYSVQRYILRGAMDKTIEFADNGDIFIEDPNDKNKIYRYIIEDGKIKLFKEMKPVFKFAHNVGGYNGRVVALERRTGKENKIIYIDLDADEYGEIKNQEHIDKLGGSLKVNRYNICWYYSKNTYVNLANGDKIQLPRKHIHLKFLSEKYSLIDDRKNNYHILNFTTGQIVVAINTHIVTIDRKRDIAYYTEQQSKNVYAIDLIDTQRKQLLTQMNNVICKILYSQDHLYVQLYTNEAYLIELYHNNDLFDNIELAMNQIADDERLTEVFQALGIVFDNLKLDMKKRKHEKNSNFEDIDWKDLV